MTLGGSGASSIPREEQGQHLTPFRSRQVFAVVQSLSSVQSFATPWTAACQAFLLFTISQSLLKLMSIDDGDATNQLILCSLLFSTCPQSFPASRSFPMSRLLPSGGQSIGASASASVLPMNIQGWFPLGLMDLISLLSRDSQESSPVPQFESINSLTFILLCGPTLTSVHDYWKNHSIDYMDLCHQNDVTLVCCIVSSSMLLMFNFYLYWGIYCTQSLKSNNIKVCFLSHHLIFHSLGLIILNLFSYCIQ